MRFDIITIFPEIFEGFLKESLLGKAQAKKKISINVHQLRDWTTDKQNMVDDLPYGGGPGMVIKVDPIYRAVKKIRSKIGKRDAKKRVILLSPRGKKFNDKEARRLAKYDQLIFIAGRYEGIDERVDKYIADESLSIGDFVTIGGEIPAMVIIETVSRFIDGVIGKKESVEKPNYPQYTRPRVFETDGKKLAVPKVLISGNHKKIKEYRERHSK